jgi:glycosyltransferase involved in cell wall biosynthesis
MKIGIDAKWYFDGPASGKVVVENLVNALCELDFDHEFVFFLDAKEKHKLFPHKLKNIKLDYVWAGNNLLSNLFILPFKAQKYDLDVLIYQNFPSLFNQYKQIAYIHDIIFLTHPEYYTWKERLYFYPLKYLVKYAHRINTVSFSEKKRILKYYPVNENKIDVIYHGVNKSFKPLEVYDKRLINKIRKKYKLPSKYLLYVGRLNIRKNITNLLKAIPLLKDLKIPLVIVGGYDWKMQNITTIIDETGISDRIYFAGPVFGEELAIIYACATLFCFPSYEESFGLPPLEAMASGVPVVVSQSSSIPEICGDAGNYVDPNSPENIANMIDILLTDKDLYNMKRKMGLERAKLFTWENAAKKLIESCEKAAEA